MFKVKALNVTVAFLMLLFIPLIPAQAGSENVDKVDWTADYILVSKAAKELTLYAGVKRIKTYKVALGRDPVGHKVRQGDRKTPEGIYFIDARNENSKYHLALHISYPDAIDDYKARNLGSSPGGGIMIHGTGDDNVHVQHTIQLVDQAWRNGVRFDLMLFPSLTHGISAPGSHFQLFGAIIDFFEKHLMDAVADRQ